MQLLRTFFLGIVFSCMLTFIPFDRVYADHEIPLTKKTTSKEPAAEPTPTPKPKVEYSLPYPGILVDHPLYFLKNFRNSLLEILITDPLKRGEFYILQADKQLNMGVFLLAANKSQLAADLIAKSDASLTKAVTHLAQVKGGGISIPGHLLDRIERSSAKHLEVLEELQATGPEDVKTVVTSALEATTMRQPDVQALK